MSNKCKYLAISVLMIFIFSQKSIKAQHLDDFYFFEVKSPPNNIIKSTNDFNGYTNYWHDTYTNLYRYGNLFKMATPNVRNTILQSKVDIAEDLGIPGLYLQEGFINQLISEEYKILEQPTVKDLEDQLRLGNRIVLADPDSDIGRKLNSKLPIDKRWYDKLSSHQFEALNFERVNAFYLDNGKNKLFVISSSDKDLGKKVLTQISKTIELIKKYDLHKGWFGAYTLLNSVTITKGHPLEVIGKGMNEGNSWFVFDGYMDFMSKTEIENWINEVKLPVVTDVGAGQIYGCKDYDEFQIQQMFSKKDWINYAQKKDGYIFRKVWDTVADPYHYDGYFAEEGNKEQIDKENVPFVLKTGKLSDNALSSMVLFIEKGQPLSRKSMWNAIMNRHEVGVLEKGKMLGPAKFRNALQMLLLDKVFLENYFGDHLDLEAKVYGYDLQVTVSNTSEKPVSGELDLVLPEGVRLKESSSILVKLPKRSIKTLHFTLQPTKEGMGHTNPIAVHYKWGGKQKSTLTMLDLPPTISVHRLLYGHSPKVSYPVTIHNFTNNKSFPVNIKVVEAYNTKKVVYTKTQACKTPISSFKNMLFDLELPAGNYRVEVSALGSEYISQLGVGKATGKAIVKEVDLDGDGVMEYYLENDSVKVALLSTGARVIEYFIKSRKDNILFKQWPKKTIDDKRPFRKRGYYPYGGFEDFLGQGSMETHQVYNAEIIKKEGDYVRVRMWTEYFGNKLEKIFTLYGDSPLLEIRFALTFKDPEVNMLGPQPILELGEKHWTEDVFMVPSKDGIVELRMMPDKYYGQAFLDIKEGWNAGYDTKQDITFVGAFPVDQPLFLHMWQNHPSNGDAHHYYAEFQPWVPIIQKTTMYFSYYIWGEGGNWKNSVNELRKRNLITIRKE